MPLWTNRYNGSANGGDFASALAVDKNGNVFVTGWSAGSGSGDDCATVAYSSAGAPLWSHRYNGPGNGLDGANAIAVGPDGSICVAGYSFNAGNHDYATIKYSASGAPLWTNLYNGPGNASDQAWAIAVDLSSNVVVTGQSLGSGSGPDFATIKYSSAGVPLWTNRFSGPGNGQDAAQALAIDASNNVVVTGSSYLPGNSQDCVTIKYSGAGVPLWTNRYNGSANDNDYAFAIALDTNGNVYVTGWSYGGGSDYDYATLKYSSTGVPLWTNRYNGPANGQDSAQALALDSGGNVIVTGYSTGVGSDYDFATLKYSADGVPLWTNRYNHSTTNMDVATAVAVDAFGNVYVTGSVFVDSVNRDLLTIAYSSAGTPLWTNRYDGPARSGDEAQAVALDSGGNVYVAGWSVGNSSGYDFVTLKYAAASPTPPVISNVLLTGSFFVLSGAGGSAGQTFYVLASTNATASMSNWVTVATNTFGPGGGFSVTNTLDAAQRRQFYRLQLP